MELVKLPNTIDNAKYGLSEENGFYFYPSPDVIERLGLIKLTPQQRAGINSNATGCYTLPMQVYNNSTDAQCHMDNDRTPTHAIKSAIENGIPLMSDVRHWPIVKE